LTSSITSKGQITVPKRVRDALGLKPGTRVDFVLEEGCVVLEAARGSGVESMAGSLKRYAKIRSRASDQVMLERVRKEVADAATKAGRARRHKRPS
jgi:AbrB family looped-hinge helix DNA binding protein